MWKVQGLLVNGSKQCWSNSNNHRQFSSSLSLFSATKKEQKKVYTHLNYRISSNNNCNNNSKLLSSPSYSSLSTSTESTQANKKSDQLLDCHRLHVPQNPQNPDHHKCQLHQNPNQKSNQNQHQHHHTYLCKSLEILNDTLTTSKRNPIKLISSSKSGYHSRSNKSNSFHFRNRNFNGNHSQLLIFSSENQRSEQATTGGLRSFHSDSSVPPPNNDNGLIRNRNRNRKDGNGFISHIILKRNLFSQGGRGQGSSGLVINGGTTNFHEKITDTTGTGSSGKSGNIGSGILKGRRGLTSFPIPGTSAAAAAQGLVKGTVVERQIWIDNEIFRRQELRSRIFEWHEPTMVTMGTVGLSPGAGSSSRNRISTEEIARVAEEFLGSERFSARLTLSDNFAQFQQIICLFLFKVARFDHPLLYITNIIEAEARHNSGSSVNNGIRTEVKNPYPWWRAMMVLLTAEMYGFPRDIEAAPPEVHWAIKDKQNRLGKIVEVAWVTHQLHRRVLDISSISSRLSTHFPTTYPMTPNEQIELLENLHKANKAITLVGDLLLTQKCAHLAALKSPIALELICNSLADFCESEFELGIKSLNPQHFHYENWLSRCELGLGSLMGHCMYSALLFSGWNAKHRKRAFQLGSLLGILYQAYDDLRFFNRAELKDPGWLDVGILPVVYHVERNPGILLKSHPEIFNAVKSCPSTMDESFETFQFLKEHALQALGSYGNVENTTARDILINFVHALNPAESLPSNNNSNSNHQHQFD